jgi:integrase
MYSIDSNQRGVSLDDIKILLGHSSVTVTEKRYAQFGRQDVLNKVNKLTGYFRLDELGHLGQSDTIQ